MKRSHLFALVVIVLALLLCGCVSDTIYWYVDGSFTEDERTAAYEACERWNWVAIRQQQIVLDEDESNRRIELSLPPHMSNGVHAQGELGPYGINIRMARGQPRDQFLMVLLHEMGHVLIDKRHIEGHGVMNENAGQIDFSEGDLAHCRGTGACR